MGGVFKPSRVDVAPVPADKRLQNYYITITMEENFQAWMLKISQNNVIWEAEKPINKMHFPLLRQKGEPCQLQARARWRH